MTTAQEQFEAWYWNNTQWSKTKKELIEENFNWLMAKDANGFYIRDTVRMSWKAWQACQDLNNKERESLIAENAMMRETLQEIIDSGLLVGSTELHDKLNDLAQKALSTKPRQVDVGEVKDDGNAHNLHGELQLALCAMPAGTKLYTIQKGE